MPDLTPVLVPLVNPNENESYLAQLAVHNGQQVKPGDLLAVFETTKSTFELLAEGSGFILGLNASAGDLLKTGARLCFLSDRADHPLPVEDEKEKSGPDKALPSDLRITQPALEFAKAQGVDLTDFPTGQLITEKMVREKLSGWLEESDPTAIIIYGGGGHAKSLIDLIRAEGKFKVAGIVDDGLTLGSRVLDVPVLGGGHVLTEIRRKGIGLAVNAVGGIGNISPRLQVYEKLKSAGFRCPIVVHPRGMIEPTAWLGEGCQVFFNAYIGSDAKVGFGCIINTGAILSHDCILGDYVNISPGAILAGAVTIKERALVGMGVTVNLNVVIGEGARVGNSAVVKADVPPNGVVRAGTTWPAV